jgi:uncharacterized membrane protein YccC
VIVRSAQLAHPLQWLARRDPDLGALRRAGRAAIVMPGLFALGDKLLEDPVLATFAGFGSFAMLLLFDFRGPLRERLQTQGALVLAGCALICLATLVARNVWLAAPATAIVGFGVIFAGVVSSVLASATTSLLLAFILPVTFAGPLSSLPDRVAGWALAGAGALIAVAVLWPAPSRDPLRGGARAACRALAKRLRAEAACVMSNSDPVSVGECERATARASEEVAALRRLFLATQYRPTSLGTAARTLVRLVDELTWLDAIVAQSARSSEDAQIDAAVCAVKLATAAVLERGDQLLEGSGGDWRPLHEALGELTEALRAMESVASARRPQPGDTISALDPSFRAQELAFAVSLIGRDIDLTAAAERRSWVERLLGRQPKGLSGTLAAAQGRAASHFDRRSVWMHNSVRGAAALAIAVIVAQETGVQHSFWVVLGTISVLRSNALSTGQNIVRGLFGTVVGVVIGGSVLTLIGANPTLLWLLLSPAILLAGIAPAVISFAAGQAAFTLTLVFLYNIIQPAGWHIGLVRVEDIAIGCGVSLTVGLLFWPRGAAPALRRALGDAYAQSATYLASAVDFAVARCESSATQAPSQADASARAAAAASRRLDDTFRGYLAEHGAKPTPLADMTSLVSGVGGLRLAGDAILELWRGEDGAVQGDRAPARRELLRESEAVRGWYEDLALSLAERREPRDPLPRDGASEERLLQAVDRDLRSPDGRATATAVRMIWTGDHLDAARRLQQVIAGPARAASEP